VDRVRLLLLETYVYAELMKSNWYCGKQPCLVEKSALIVKDVFAVPVNEI